MDLLICDYCGPLRPSGPQQFHYVFLAVDFFSKFVFSFRVKSCSAETTIKCLKEIFLERGLCRKLFHDAGTHFTAGSVKKFLSDLNIIQIQAPRYAHSSVGQVERCVGIIKTILTRYCVKESDWSYYLKMCTFFYNSSYVESIGMAPSEVMNGRMPWWPMDLRLLPPKPMTIPQLKTALSIAEKHVVKTFASHHSRMRKRFNKGRKQPLYYPNQKVLVLTKAPSPFGMTKFTYQRGTIIYRLGRVVYNVKIRRGGRKRTIPVHIRHIKPYFVRPNHLKP